MKRALLLEDDAICAAVATSLLEAQGFTVTHWRSAKAARAACTRRFALYLIDVGVRASESGGEGDGLAFVTWLRVREPSARVIVWSAADHGARARELGADFILKDEQAMAGLAALLRS